MYVTCKGFKWRIFSHTSSEQSSKNKKNIYFSYWAWSTPWRHVLSLKTFCQNPALSWAISYSVFQPVKFTSSFEFVCGTLFSTFDIWWSSLDISNDFKAISRIVFFRFGEINKSWILNFEKKIFLIFFSCLLNF